MGAALTYARRYACSRWLKSRARTTTTQILASSPSFDNVSGVPAWLSDALCRLASGGSLAVRQLYTDDTEVLFEAARPMLLNGIEDVVEDRISPIGQSS